MDIKNIAVLKLLDLSHGTDSLKHSWAYLPHHSWVKINILKTSAVSLITVSVVRTEWSQPATELTKPYKHTEGIAWFVIWKPYNCNWDSIFRNRFLVLNEDLKVVILRTCATSGSMAFEGNRIWLDGFWDLNPSQLHEQIAFVTYGESLWLGLLWLKGMSAMFLH